MKAELFATVVYFVFVIQLIISTLFFICNARSIRTIPLYVKMLEKMSWKWRLIPVFMSIALGLVAACVTGYHATSTLAVLLVMPILYHHWIMSPISVRSVSGIGDMRNPEYRKVIVKGVRSRLLTLSVCVNLFLMYYAFFNLEP